MENKDFSYLLDSLKDFLNEAGFKSSVKTESEISCKINVLATIGITGDKVGFLTLSTDFENAVSLSRLFAKLMEIPFQSDNFGELHIEAISELSNQIAGRVVMFMENNSLNCSITPPSVLSGGNISFNSESLQQTKLFRVEGEFGLFFISIGFK